MTQMPEEIEAMESAALQDRIDELESAWERLDRKSDPVGTYAARQEAIEEELRVTREVLRRRAEALPFR